MHGESSVALSVVEGAASSQRFVAVALCLLAVVALLFSTFADMASIWHRTGTYAHGYLVLPIVLYMIWEQRARLAQLPLRPSGWPVVGLLASGAVWLLGELASARTPSYFAAVAMMPLVVAAVLGTAWVRALGYPLACLFFAVPFGEVFVPALIEWTADFAVVALRLSGVPVLRQGADLITPTGHWSVVEACSGIRYLIASTFVGALYAWFMYRSPLRRALFMLAAVLVPIVANWVRAYGIILLGHLSDNRIATGVDHLVYGWLFFGVVVALLFAVGAIWREDLSGKSLHTAQTLQASPSSPRIRLVAAILASAAAIAVWPLAAVRMSAVDTPGPVPPLTVIEAAGWRTEPAPLSTWRPRLQSPRGEISLVFARDDVRIGVHVGVYREQHQDAELVNSVNTLLPDASYNYSIESGRHRARIGAHDVEVNRLRFRAQGQPHVAWQYYWLGDRVTGSDARAKLDLALARLTGRDDSSAWLALYVLDDPDAALADRRLAQFAADMGEPLHEALRALTEKWR